MMADSETKRRKCADDGSGDGCNGREGSRKVCRRSALGRERTEDKAEDIMKRIKAVATILARPFIWIYQNASALIICATCGLLLWVLHGYSQNGRYVFRPSGERTEVLDTRTGTVYFMDGSAFLEVNPHTGKQTMRYWHD
jgi:hypothetical protein